MRTKENEIPTSKRLEIMNIIKIISNESDTSANGVLLENIETHLRANDQFAAIAYVLRNFADSEGIPNRIKDNDGDCWTLKETKYGDGYEPDEYIYQKC